ncbi:MAG: CHAT domain-containing protein [Prolixibacteraceae bacterium]|nr:CHAT domain-containing protein [Prolixibacteraceae bacterium]
MIKCGKYLLYLLFFLMPKLVLAESQNFRTDSLKAVALNRSASNFGRQGLYSESLDSLFLSLNIRKRIYNENNYKSFASTYRLIGTNYKNLGLFDLAIQYSLLAEQAYIQGYGENYLSTAYVYLNLGNIYRSKLNNNEAIQYYNQMVNIYKNQKKINIENVAGAYYSVAEIYYRMNKYNESLEIIDKYLKNADDDTKILFFDLSGAIFQELNRNKEASESYKKAIQYSISQYTDTDLVVAMEYLNFASFLISVGNSGEAIEMLAKAYNIIYLTEKTKGENLANYYQVMGDLHKNKQVETKELFAFKKQKYKNLQQALVYYNKALFSLNFPENNLSGINLDSINCISEIRCLDHLKIIADTYMQIVSVFEDKNSGIHKKSLTKALEYYKITGLFIHKLRKGISGDESKIQLAELEQSTFINIIQASYKAYLLNGDLETLELAFNNAERLKASAIFDKLSDQLAKENSLIPDSLNRLEQTINLQIASYSEELFYEQDEEQQDRETIAELDSTLFQLKKQRTELNSYLENNYNDYYELKYSDSFYKISEIQQKLKKNEVLLEYVLNETDTLPELYTFLISTNKLSLIKQEVDNEFLGAIDNVFHFMSDPGYLFTKNSDSKRYCKASNLLHQKLIFPFKNEIKGKKIIIVPDGKLNYISFDALIEKMPDTTKTINFKNLDYLIKKNTINYSYSANLLFKFNDVKQKTKNSALAFAPIYSADTFVFENQKLILMPIPGIQKEVDLISKEIKTKLYKGDQATVLNFRDNVEDYDILHLAMHAFINDSIPALSRFAFSQNRDKPGENDRWINTADIYNLDLNARLTVLSACNTGSGKLRKGEGVMSLARGFFYAGCPSIVMTLWETEDNSGTQIMSSFYKNLKKGKSKDDALRFAKLDYLKNSKSRLAHPHYWLGYVRDQFNYRVGGIKSFLLSFIHGNGNTTTPLTARRVI